MKKVYYGLLVALLFMISSSTTYAADVQIKIDGTVITSDAKPEMKNSHTMVPIRVISENLGATVNWSDSEVTLAKKNLKVKLNLNSNIAEKNGEKIVLDAKPYLKNKRIIVPLRFIAEAFGCKVSYSNFTVNVDTQPLVIDGVPVKALQQEFHMTMGGVISQIKVNAYSDAFYNIFMENKGNKVEAPANYSWMYTMDIPGTYYKEAQYDFLDLKGNSIQRYDIYTLIKAFPEETLEGYPEVLIYDAIEEQWYLFSETARQSINQLLDTASKNGLFTIISNTVV